MLNENEWVNDSVASDSTEPLNALLTTVYVNANTLKASSEVPAIL